MGSSSTNASPTRSCVLSPSPTRSLPRSPSSPSIAQVGIPPQLSESALLPPCTPPVTRTYNYTPGSASPTRHPWPYPPSSSPATETLPAMVDSTPSTPRRKVVNAMEAPTPRSGKKRPNLQERLNAAATPSTKIPRMSQVHTPIGAPSVPRQSVATPTHPPRESVATPSRPPRESAVTPTRARASTATPSRPRHSKDRGSDKVVVCMRIKPTTSRFSHEAYETSPTTLSLTDQHPNVQRRGGKAGREAEYTYVFDTLMQHPMRTPELYEDKVAPLVEKAMKGFNSTVFAYGQTGSGKSYTMSGTRTELGIIPCAVDGVFDAITADTDRAFLLRVSYLEIYNETIRDLLSSKRSLTGEEIRPTIHTSKGKVFVDPLVEEIVSTPQDVVDLLDKGNNNRKTGATDWNERSSRSHAVFTIVIESRLRDSCNDDEIRVSRLTLIDLAGSEKAVSDLERRGEGKHINKSLFALREVVHKLTEPAGQRGHVPYRNSKLTFLLENVLGGDSNICVICTMSAEHEHTAETLETLKFAGRCSQVETKAQKNILLSSDRAVIRAKDMEIADLKRQLEEMGGSGSTTQDESTARAQLAEALAAMETRKVKLQEDLARLNGEILTSELPRSGTGLPLSPARKRRPRISDFSSFAGAGLSLGLGTPHGTPKKGIDRRAVSTMVRVPEAFDFGPDPDESIIDGLDQTKLFDQDLTIASLKRTITNKDESIAGYVEKLDAALADANSLEAVKADLAIAKKELEDATAEHATKLTDAEGQLVAAQSAMAETVAEKTTRIEALEASVKDLQQALDKLSKEGQERVKKLESELAAVVKERDSHLQELQQLRETHEKDIASLKESLASLQTQKDDHIAKIAALEAARSGVESALSTAQAEREAARSDHAKATREAEQAASDLEALKKASEGRESEALATFKAELDQECESRTKAETALQEVKRKAEAATDDAAAEKAHLEALVNEANDKVATLETGKSDAERQVEGAAAALKAAEIAAEEAAKAAKSREDELNDKITSATAESDKHRSAGEELSAALAAAKLQLEEKRGLHSNATRELDGVRAQFDEKTKAHAELEAQLKQANDALAEKTTAYEAAAAELGDLKKQFEAAAQAHEAAIREHEDTKAKLEQVTKSHDETSRDRDAVKAQLEETTQAHSTMTRERDDAKLQLEAKTKSYDEAAQELESLRAGASVADSVRADLERHRELLEAEKAQRSELAEKLASANEHGESLTKRLEDAEVALATEKTSLTEKVAQLASAAGRVEGLESKLSAEETARKDLSAQLETQTAAAKDAEGRLEAARSESGAAAADLLRELDQARASLETLRKDSEAAAAKLQAELDGARDAMKEGEEGAAKLRDAQANDKRTIDDQAKLIETLRAELAAEKQARIDADEAAQKAKRNVQQELAQVQTDLTATKTELDSANAALTEERGMQSGKSKELMDTLENVASLKTLLGRVQKENIDARARSERLAAELVKVSANQPEPSNAPRRRGLASSKSVPSGLSTIAADALRGKGVMSTAPDVEGWKRSHEAEEIERLDKVVESQKAIIAEQRDKIMRWAAELDRQRELVGLLTGEGTEESRGGEAEGTPTRRGHMRSSMSMSHVPSPNASGPGVLSPAPNGYSSARSRGHITPSFTARNLALPSASAPTPLPMHPSQYSNVLRKARRVTLEHDINRLQEGGRVKSIKNVFDSPGKEDTPPTPSLSRVGSRHTDVRRK